MAVWPASRGWRWPNWNNPTGWATPRPRNCLPMIYRGSLNGASIRIAEVFREAIRCNAASIIVSHSHPSGDPSPSAEDVQVTRELVQAGQMLGIEVLDHIVVAQNRYVSLKERGLGFDTVI